MSVDRPLFGIVLMIGFCVLAPLGDAMAKLIGAAVPLAQLVLVRYAIQAILLWPLARRGGYVLRTTPRLFRLLVLRTFLQMSAFWFMVLSLRYLPLADAIAIAYVMPFLMLLLGRFLLDEEVGSRRLAACIVGFAGTMMVMQPSLAEVGWVATLPLLVAVLFASFILVTRKVAREIEPIPLQAITGLMGTLLLFPLVLLGEGTGWAEFDPVEPTLREIMLLCLMALFGTASHLMMAGALRFAPAATLAPMQYLEIPFAALFGWLIFSQFPNGLALAGIAVVMAAGLYIILRERQVARLSVRQSPLKAPPGEG